NDRLKPNVTSIWGTRQEQMQPVAFVDQGQTAPVPLAAESSRIHVNLALEYRQKGLLWYSTYVVDFSGLYTFRNPMNDSHGVTFQIHFPSKHAIYDGLAIELNGRPLPFTANRDSAFVSTVLAPGQTAAFRASYRSQGLDSWRYNLGDDVTQTRNFELTMNTNFKAIDFPASTLAATEKRKTKTGWELAWRYRNLISGFQIGMIMPEKLQPGPLAGDISRFAPVSLLLFFFVMFILTTVRNIDLHPMNYFFLAAAFFAFHLLLAYLVDHIAVQLAVFICSLVSMALVVSYLRLVVGPRFAVVEAGLAQLIYLVAFSYTFFLKGFTGLAVTLGCIVTLFIAMQMTGRIRWSERFGSTSSRVPNAA
ncbi:MAG TPA: inner membrane CreD family protein, partial [Bryobacteraceae bacterium]